jgi:hypothetical protein
LLLHFADFAAALALDGVGNNSAAKFNDCNDNQRFD